MTAESLEKSKEIKEQLKQDALDRRNEHKRMCNLLQELITAVNTANN